MTIRNWIRLFFSTLMIGGLVTGISGLILRWDEFAPWFSDFELGKVISVFLWLVVVGFTFSVISQMGFFAYLTIHQFGMGMFRSFWKTVQIVITLFVLFDLIYFRFDGFMVNGEIKPSYIILFSLILVTGLVVAYLKNKQSGQNTFVSAIFFMVVVTVLEWLPVLQAKESKWLFLMLFALLACNAYQLLALPKFNRRSEEERKSKK
ncbi:KinB-signaling pathway activation protein [Rossellomorea vietnamensis]|uniref:KinB-signaling pathway activation protein n=2 Tax=Rossellomorea TaxID=2837508 RepID=A0A5D4K709_9BACI|nr:MULTISPECIES: KinB-signaling pathway activation protein [Rossellomorea]TYR73104.1 KinB-signaling pathway activation protein [Rossellomorea vietnamensis]TYS73296.1 KinB-signaling pathway activation protein [Rossellomorea aquimaris]